VGSRISSIQHSLGGAENVTARRIVQGTQYEMPLTFRDASGAAIDMTNWDVKANAEYYEGHVDDSGEIPSVSGLTLAGLEARALAVTGDAAKGAWAVQVPGDLYPGDIPPDATVNVPIVGVCVTITDDSTPAVIRRFRHLILVRRGW